MNKRFLNSDVNLIRRLRRSDKQAFEIIFNEFKEKLYYYIFGYLHSSEESKEILQNIFISLWENRESLKEEYQLSHYIYKVAVNHIYNYFKHQAVRQRYVDHVVSKQSIEDDYPQQSLITRDLQNHINKIIDHMPCRQQEIFKMSRRDGLTYEEISVKTGLTVRAVESQIYRALKLIREKLREESLFAD